MTAAPPRRPMVGASLACFRDGKVLIARRACAPARGLWSLPGGRIEFGETAAEAAARELLEETGVRATVIGLAEVVEAIMTDADGAASSHAVILAYAGRWEAGEPAPGEEAEAVAWAAPHEIDAYETTPGLASVVARAAEMVP